MSTSEKTVEAVDTTTAVPLLPPPARFDPRLHFQETLGDGSRVLIRPIGKDDAGLERAFIERLTPESREYRFLGQVNVDDNLAKRLTDINLMRDMAFIALRHEAGQTREIGVSRFYIDSDGQSCECTVVVSDEWQGRGLGHLLMRHLIEVARHRGIKRMISIDIAGNQKMRELALSLGFERKIDPEYPSEAIHVLTL